MSGEFHPRDFRRGLRGVGLTAAEYRVAIELSEYAGVDKSTVWPSVATLAADCGIHRATVIRALNGLASRGVISAPEGRGGGRSRATRWQLKGRTDATVSDGERVANPSERVANPSIKGRTGATRRRKEVDKEEEPGARAPSLPAISIPEEPDPHCPDHMPFGTRLPCGPCGTARVTHDAWTQTVEQVRAAKRAAIRQAIDRCPDCDAYGRLDDLSDCPRHSNFRRPEAA